jgi:hypothetical protein
MLRICCSIFHVGPRVFGEKPPFENREETHGFCPACFTLELQEVIKEKEKEERENGVIP